MQTLMTMRSPIGTLCLAAEDDRLVGLYLPDRPAPTGPRQRSAVLTRAAAQLDEYFAGERRRFDLPIDLRIATEFPSAVLKELARVPYGQLTTYGTLAARAGRPRAARAVGTIMNRNPVPIVLPCHRVVGSTGALTGYGGGLDRKRALLELEGSLNPSLK
jgi:methylated-DNA-[protein]-cysteine S-methyltransferase